MIEISDDKLTFNSKVEAYNSASLLNFNKNNSVDNAY